MFIQRRNRMSESRTEGVDLMGETMEERIVSGGKDGEKVGKSELDHRSSRYVAVSVPRWH